MSQALAIHGGKPVRTNPFPTWPIFDQREERALVETLRSGKWGKLDGGQVETFEKHFAKFQNAKHAIGVCNGTVSLRIALMAAGIEAGDEVIVPPYTFLATATAVVEANATPVFVDIERETFNIDPVEIEKAITPRTRAIIVVHLGGMPCDMQRIMSIAKKHNITVIEDAAHAHGSEYKSRRVGAIGHLGSFSFQSSKNLCSGEGGIIVTDDDALAERCRSIHNCGRIPGGAWYEHHVISGNYRLGEFAGAVLNCQLERLDEQTNRRNANAKFLDEKLSQIPGITPQLRSADCTRGAYHLYLFRYDEEVFGAPRETFLNAMEGEGIPAAAGYVLPLHRQPLFQNVAFGPYKRPGVSYENVRLPVCERVSEREGAWLYQNILLGTQEDMDDVVSAFEKIYENRKSLC